MKERIDTEALQKMLDEATPGPWRLCAHLRLPDENGCRCGYRGVIYGGDTDFAICQPGHDVTDGEEGLDPPRYPRSVEIANARLIALAPDLARRAIAAENLAEAAFRMLQLAEIEGKEAEAGCSPVPLCMGVREMIHHPTDGNSIGFEDGEICGREGCTGLISTREVENCSCHIDPPCGPCTTPTEHCPDCDWQLVDDEVTLNDFRVGPVKPNGAWTHYRPRPLDPTKIDWRSKSHTNASMIKEGTYPQSGDEASDRAAVLALVEGTFGGRFNHFGNGRFEYVAYTD